MKFDEISLIVFFVGSISATASSPTGDAAVPMKFHEPEAVAPNQPEDSPGTSPDQLKKCASKRAGLRDIGDMFNWVKRGPSRVQCRYMVKNATRQQNSISKLRGFNDLTVIPVEDGYAYEFVSASGSDTEILVRKPKKDHPLKADRFQKVFLPHAGIKVLAQIDKEYGRMPIHGVEGFYGYDHFDGPYHSPTKTNPEEDLVFNITLVATVMDIMSRLFPQELEAACAADGLVSSGKPVSSRSGRAQMLGKDDGAGGSREFSHIHGDPNRLMRDMPEKGIAEKGDRFKEFGPMTTSVIFPSGSVLTFDLGITTAGQSTAHNLPVRRPVGANMVYKRQTRSVEKPVKGIDLVF